MFAHSISKLGYSYSWAHNCCCACCCDDIYVIPFCSCTHRQFLKAKQSLLQADDSIINAGQRKFTKQNKFFMKKMAAALMFSGCQKFLEAVL